MSAHFESLVRQNIGRIKRIAMRYADPDEIEDMIQEILLALWRSLDSFQGNARIETWVYKIALNTAMSGVRKNISKRNVKEKFAGLFNEEAMSANTAEEDILSDFLQSLNPIDASVLMMTLDGMTPKDIEEVLGTSANAIAVRVNRIKQRFIDTYID